MSWISPHLWSLKTWDHLLFFKANYLPVSIADTHSIDTYDILVPFGTNELETLKCKLKAVCLHSYTYCIHSISEFWNINTTFALKYKEIAILTKIMRFQWCPLWLKLDKCIFSPSITLFFWNLNFGNAFMSSVLIRFIFACICLITHDDVGQKYFNINIWNLHKKLDLNTWYQYICTWTSMKAVISLFFLWYYLKSFMKVLYTLGYHIIFWEKKTMK